MTHDTTCSSPPPARRRGPARAPSARPTDARSTDARSTRRRWGRRGAFVRACTLAAAAVALGTVAVPTLPPPAATADDLTFPWSTGFDDAAGGTLSGSAVTTGGRLRLTEATRNQAGAWAMGDVFPSSLGLDIEFDYAMWTSAETGADGLLLSLSDGSVPAGVGAYGSALGYACRSDTTQGSGPCTLPGLPGAFAAVALDEYGNFSLPFNGSGPGQTPDTVTIRGSGDGVSGYRFVDHAVVTSGVATGSPATRTVRVTLLPEDGRLSLTVQLETPDGMHTVLDRVPLQGSGQAALPETLRLGFAGATGSFSSVHEIDDLHVSQPADLRVQHDMPPVVAGGQVRYTVTASNVGANASSPSPLDVDVPDGVHDVHWTCAATAPSTCTAPTGTGDVHTALGLERGGSATVTIEGTADPDATGTLTSTATVRTAPGLADTNEADNTSVASAPVTAVAQLSTGKSVTTTDPVAPGDEVEYVLTARNSGPSTARDVGAVDDLPAQLTFVGSDDGCTAEGQRVTCTSDADLAPGQEHAFEVRARLDPEYRGDGSDVVNVATATSPTDPDGGEESPEVPIRVVDPEGPGGPAGPEGPEGPGGPTGPAGPVGPTGPAGTVGPAGPTASGHSGASPSDAPRGGAGERGVGPGKLAYTGSSGLAVTGAAAAALAAAGGGVWFLLRRRRRSVGPDAAVGDDAGQG
ncbi:DUF11 domain-containing protein [Curtobacterium sp. MCSS17_015]|uniref:lectin-like domain-containing protein n=1 Tax=Curtobacterium sp. MCSS17_015 TaxID=2175666 RepID=UPI000DA9E085|nr:DUF11 domain-containing protein [Curtobacterium sp. MCSS17_015]WIB26815.1 DUF11 domain-containing protein [Curtobacterium sp. MCSS17_015]